jgi:hypothetical protein
VSGFVSMLCDTGPILGGTEGAGFRFHIFCSRTRFGIDRGPMVQFSSFAFPDSFLTIPMASGPVFIFLRYRTHFGRYRGRRIQFNVLRSWTYFGRYRGRRVQLSCFALPDSFWVVPRVSGPVFMFCAPGLIFGGTEGVGLSYYVLRS